MSNHFIRPCAMISLRNLKGLVRSFPITDCICILRIIAIFFSKLCCKGSKNDNIAVKLIISSKVIWLML
ncbi:hypothetical protein MRB53_007498 [Persea americana]|uniref:Uncharacterized protein n=1 Tax=Persea americana TaxID=3435 RepID=A0ACC2MJD1_PERAE|nr:hypothetical protein MRB53_007498 [Persea americana]